MKRSSPARASVRLPARLSRQSPAPTRSAICRVLRPVIGMDKDEIVLISRKIDTFETSILPYEDCCTVFTPKHPRTKPQLKFVKYAEEQMDSEQLIQRAIDGIELLSISNS